jgi:hypothetical protein
VEREGRRKTKNQEKKLEKGKLRRGTGEEEWRYEEKEKRRS